MQLIVLIHGWLLEDKDLNPLKNLMELDSEFDESNVVIFSYNASLFSNERLEDIAEELNLFLETKFQSSIYDKISIVGHSIGGLLARKAYLE